MEVSKEKLPPKKRIELKTGSDEGVFDATNGKVGEKLSRRSQELLSMSEGPREIGSMKTRVDGHGKDEKGSKFEATMGSPFEMRIGRVPLTSSTNGDTSMRLVTKGRQEKRSLTHAYEGEARSNGEKCGKDLPRQFRYTQAWHVGLLAKLGRPSRVWKVVDKTEQDHEGIPRSPPIVRLPFGKEVEVTRADREKQETETPKHTGYLGDGMKQRRSMERESTKRYGNAARSWHDRLSTRTSRDLVGENVTGPAFWHISKGRLMAPSMTPRSDPQGRSKIQRAQAQETYSRRGIDVIT